MQRTLIKCDHCGKEMDRMMDYDDLQIDMGHKWTTCDLCAECLDELYEVVISFLTHRKENNNERLL